MFYTLVFMCRDPGDSTSKVYVVLSLLSVFKIAFLMLALECPSTPLKMSLPKNETTVNVKSAFFVVIILLHKGLTLGCILARVLLQAGW